MEFTDNDDDQALSELIAKLHQRIEISSAAQDFNLDPSWRHGLWPALGETGLLGLVVPESLGGGDGSAWQARVVCEAMGAALDLSPFVWSSVAAATVLGESEPSELRDRLLASLVAGAVVGVAHVGRRGELRPLQEAEAEESLRIPHGEDATWVLVPRSDPAGVRLLVIETACLGTRLTSEPRSDLQMLTESTMAELASAEIGSVAMSLGGWARAACVTRVALAAYALGAQRRLVQLASDYARNRQQFGRPIGSFQAVAHRCVDMHVRAEADAVLVDYAAWQVAATGGDSLSDRLSRLAKARTLSGAAAAAASALQVFAGHGFAMDGDVQRFFRRTQGLSVTWGSAAAEFDALAAEHAEVWA